MNCKQIQQKFEEQLKAELGVTVEVTHRGDNLWTISSEVAADAWTATNWLVDYVSMVVESSEYDDELEEQFIYLTAP